MRDIALTLVILAMIPYILRAPWYGILAWTWIGFMNPHRQTWGFAFDFPWGMLIAGVTLWSLYRSQEPKHIPWTRESRLLLVFTLWMFITLLFAVNPDAAWFKWDKVWKIMLFVFLTTMLINDKHKLNLLIWVIVISIGYYGVKGGIFTLRTGGAHIVYGPQGSFIENRGEIGTAFNMTLPLMRYLQLNTKNFWIRQALTVVMLLTLVSVFGTQSRGAFLGGIVVLTFLILKSRRKLLLTVTLALAVYGAYSFMPPEWEERMRTIETYEEDASAWGRVSTWQDIVKFVNRNPIVGGGFDLTAGRRAAHSVWFQILGDHGYPGFALFVLLGLFTWMSASRIRRKTKRDPENRWMGDLALMTQVSIATYATGGAFVSLGYFDYIYTLTGVIVILKTMLARQESLSREAEQTPQGQDRTRRIDRPETRGQPLKSR